MAGEFKKEPESTRARLAQQDSQYEYQQAVRRAQDAAALADMPSDARLGGGDMAGAFNAPPTLGAVGGPMFAPSNTAANQRMLLEEAVRQHASATEPGRLGFQGPHGFVAYPGIAECGDAFDVWARRVSASMQGVAVGTAQAPNTPAKMFSRETICAIIRAERTRPQTEASLQALSRLQSIFENLE